MQTKLIELAPIKETIRNYELIEKRILEVFYELLYLPLIKYLDIKQTKIKNSISDLTSAITSGDITYSNGLLRGKFSSKISRELKRQGARFNPKSGSFSLKVAEMSYEVKLAISLADTIFRQKMVAIDKILSSISANTIQESIKTADLFEKSLKDVDNKFERSVKHVTVSPKLPEPQRQKIADEWQNNLDLHIKNFTDKQVKELRTKIHESTMSGNRYESMIKTIKDSYNVTEHKARFLARQETSLLMTKYKETRYLAAGIKEYKWACVKMPHDQSPHHHIPGNVRYSHGKLDGKIFSWDKPPNTANPGQPPRYNNPNSDYNCLPGGNLITLNSSIEKIFRRRYSGELTLIITDNGIVHRSTGNHPVLTNRGWIGAKDINVGDYIFQSNLIGSDITELNTENMITSIENTFYSLSFFMEVRGDLLTESDFHNDVFEDKEVDIISIDRDLLLNRIAKLYQMISEVEFEFSNTSTFGQSHFLQSFFSIGQASFNKISILSEIATILFRHFAHSDIISFRARSDINTSGNQPFSKRSSCNIIFNRDCKLTHPILIIINSLLNRNHSIPRFESSDSLDDHPTSSKALAENIRMDFETSGNLSNGLLRRLINPLRIVDKRVIDFNGHVYNLQTNEGWYISDKIAVSNCRCFGIPIVREKKEK